MKDKLKVAEGGKADEAPQVMLPNLLDVCTPMGSKVCPFMAPTVMMMPNLSTAPRTGIALMGRSAGEGPQAVYVRNFVPCVQAQCAAWHADEVKEGEAPTGSCRLIK